MFFVCHAFLSFHCSHVVSCLERADLFARLFLKFSCVLSLFPCPLSVWCLIVSILIFAVLLTLTTQNNDYMFQRTSFNKRNKLKVDGVNPIIKQFLCEPYRFLHMPWKRSKFKNHILLHFIAVFDKHQKYRQLSCFISLQCNPIPGKKLVARQ